MISKILSIVGMFDNFVIVLALFSLAIFVFLYALNLIAQGVKYGRHLLKSRRTH